MKTQKRMSEKEAWAWLACLIKVGQEEPMTTVGLGGVKRYIPGLCAAVWRMHLEKVISAKTYNVMSDRLSKLVAKGKRPDYPYLCRPMVWTSNGVRYKTCLKFFEETK